VKARPAAYGDSLYVATVTGKIAALNRATGALRWSTTVPASGALTASPCPTPDGGVVVASDNGRVYLLRQSDGSLVRTFPSAGSLGAITGTPAVPSGLGVWVTSASGAVRLLSPDLTTIRWEAATGSPITTSPFVSSNDGLVFVTGGNNVMYAWNAATGNPAPGWLGSGINLGGPSQSSPWVSNGWAVAGRDDHALAGLLVSGTGYAPGFPLRPFGVREFSSPPVVVNETMYVGSAGGKFYALGRTTGSADPGAAWRVFDSATVGLPGQFLAAACVTGPTSEDRVVAACTNGYLYAFTLNP
jgi:outer membrane protein assembly factor BamB